MNISNKKILVTGAFSFTGKYIALELLKRGFQVKTLTGHPDSSSYYYNRIEIYPYNFNDYNSLVSSLEDVDFFINTYWIRFPKGITTWDDAINNSHLLINACNDAGVKKFIHLSVTNPSENSPYPYFKGKAKVESIIKESGLPFVIIRPALIFEKDDILINNIAYFLRLFPFFLLFGSGKYKIQPIFQQDLAEIIVDAAINSEYNKIIDTIGPKTYTFIDMIKIIRKSIGCHSFIIPFPGTLRWIPFSISKLLGWWKRDIILTRYEMDALRDNLLLTNAKAIGKTRFDNWCNQNQLELGIKYAHEIKRHYD